MRGSGATTLADALPLPPRALPDPLIEALARGEAGALRAVYRDHQAHLRAFALRLVGDEGAADDLVHEVFVALPRAMRRFRQDAALRTFLVAMAVNLARKHVRTATRRRAAQRRLALEASTAAAGPPHPDHSVERRQLAAALTAALDTLPLDQRIAFVLCEVDERPTAEAAALVGTSEVTLRGRLFHARKKLRVALAAAGFGGQEGGA